jgi:hypothetical protein
LEAAYRFIVLLLERTTRKREGLGGERCRHKLRALRQEAEDKFGSETEMERGNELGEEEVLSFTECVMKLAEFGNCSTSFLGKPKM